MTEKENTSKKLMLSLMIILMFLFIILVGFLAMSVLNGIKYKNLAVKECNVINSQTDALNSVIPLVEKTYNTTINPLSYLNCTVVIK